MQTSDSHDSPLLNNQNNDLGSPTYGTRGAKLKKDPIPHSRSNLIETEDVSFMSMIGWLLWKNYKQQLQRRKKSWIVKMLLPIIFTLILGAIRSAFTDDNNDADYGNSTTTFDLSSFNLPISQYTLNYTLNQPFAINKETINSDVLINLPLCVMNWFEPAPFISIVPEYNYDPHIAAVIDIMKKRWTFNGTVNQTRINTQGCIQYATQLPFEEGWLLKYFKTDADVDSWARKADYGKGYKVNGNITSSEMNNRPIAFGISFDPPTDNGLTWSYSLRFNATGDSQASQQGGGGPPSPFGGTLFPVPSTSQPKINNFNRNLYDQWSAGPGNYYYSFFLHWQNYIDAAINEYIASISDLPNEAEVIAEIDDMTKGFFVFPTPAYDSDDFWTTITGLFVFFILIAFVYPYSQIVKALVEEKAGKIKEGIKMMGATFSSFWLSWYLWFWFEFIIMACSFTFVGAALDVFKYSDITVIWVWMILFCVNCVTYATLVSTIFDNPKVASLIGVFMFIIALYGGFFAIVLDDQQKVALCLLGPSCFSTSLTNLGQYEQSLIGLQWSNIGDKYNGFAFVTTFYMLAFDSVLYILLTLYMDQCFPSRYGQRKSPFFIFLPSYWCPKKNKIQAMNINSSNVDLQRRFTLEDTDNYEPLGDKYNNITPAIAIRQLKKYFTSFMSDKVVKAVDNISCDIYNGEVFCLLGHNGAGKTTTINMLTGLLDVTDGGSWILGNNINDGMRQIRKSLGVCPQHDVLFSRLTVREHLELFCRLKGVPSRLIKDEVDRTIDDIGVRDKEHDFPPNLSGGQKRKLSLGIALIGGSKIVFLDEPTSGMDPQSRRVTWELIAREKKNRCIVLTTHFMDEADILADRIAIMSTGRICCCGSSLFLKRLYGVGYTFTISLNIGIHPQTVKMEIDEIVLNSIKGSSIISVAGGEISYRLPFEETSSFADVFDKLDNKKSDLSVSTYGISITTLEEVFLKIGEEHREEIEGGDLTDSESSSSNLSYDDTKPPSIKLHTSGNAVDDDDDYDDRDDEKLETITTTVGLLPNELEKINKSLKRHKSDYEKVGEVFPQPTFQLEAQSEIVIFLEHFFAILYRRWFWGIRDFRALCCQVLLPGYFASVGLAILKLTTTINNPNLVLTTDQFYGSNAGVNGYNVPYSNISGYNNNLNWGWNSSLLETYEELYEDSAGIVSPVNLPDSSSYNVTHFQTYLLDHYDSNTPKWHYNAFWTSNGYYLPNYTIPDGGWFGGQQELNNTVQIGINCTAVHSLPAVYNLVNNVILKDKININASIKVASHPLPITSNEKAISDTFGGIFASLFLMIAFAFIPVGAVYNIVMDRSNLTKHQQLVSGISFVSYWVGNFVADFIAAIPAMLLVFILIHAFDVDVYLGDAQIPFLTILILFTLAILPFTYILSYLFTAPDKAQTVIGTIYLVLGMVLLIVSFILDGINDTTKEVNDAFENVYRIFPTFLMADGLFQVALKPLIYPHDGYFKWDVIGRDSSFLAIECVGYFLVVLLIEYVMNQPAVLTKLGFITNSPNVKEETLDDDVESEMKRIQHYMSNVDQASASSINNGYSDPLLPADPTDKRKQISDTCPDTVVLAGLRKVYKGVNGKTPTIAVNDVFLGVPQGQVFGYLGVNGAGKTTTLSCLTGEKFKSGGEAYIHGISISNQIACRRYIGYCPQFDALFDLLTGKEHLKFYGMLKGLRGKKLKDQVNLLLKVLSLTKYKNRKAGTYSGGNKRKLSVAISMIGNPPVVFLDEPSTGMDPMARRHMWEFIRETMNGRCVLLTTHSMEECEALCHRLGIMVAGRLRCLGTPQHLKSKFGKGYQLDIQIENDDEKEFIQISNELNNVFNLRLVERNQTKVTFELENDDKDINKLNNDKPRSLADMFRILEELKKKLPIVSYALNQTTLEQIFIRMAKKHDGVSEF